MFYLINGETFKLLVNETKSKKKDYLTKDEVFCILDRACWFKIEIKKAYRFFLKGMKRESEKRVNKV